jgi:hypothetical protein
MQFAPEAERFAGFLRRRLAGGELASPFLGEILDFELALEALRAAPRRRLLAELAQRPPGSAWRLHPLVRVVRFAHEPAALLGALGAGRVPDEAEATPGEYHLVLDGTGPELGLRPLDTRFGAVLERVSGGAPVRTETRDARPLIGAGLLVPA